jgi:hypothetical protein
MYVDLRFSVIFFDQNKYMHDCTQQPLNFILWKYYASSLF